MVLTGGKDTIGIRIPDHPFVRALLARLDFPLAQTSANISDDPASKTPAEAAAYFENIEDKPDIIIDGGSLPSTSSTVIDFTSDHPIMIRACPITKSELDALLQPRED